MAIRGCPWPGTIGSVAGIAMLLPMPYGSSWVGINDSSLAIADSPALNPGETACLLVSWSTLNLGCFPAFLGGLMWDFLCFSESLVADSFVCGSSPRNILLID